MNEAAELETKLRGAFQLCEKVIAGSQALVVSTTPEDTEAGAVWLSGELEKYRRYMDIIARALTALPDDDAQRAVVLRDACAMFEEMVRADYQRDYRSN